nr:reverse transcriptase domain-containing protein [Tanacetum cinerariifolium]
MTNLHNEISNFQQRFDESFHEVWDRYKELLYACPHPGFTELHQLDTFYNALNPADQDSLNSIAGGNLLKRHTQDVLTIIENKSKVRNSRNKSIVSHVNSSDANSSSSSEIAKLTHAVNQQTSVVTTAMTAILKQFQATLPLAFVKAIEEICVTCGGAHPYYQSLAANGNTFPEFRDNIQGYVSAATVNYNQGPLPSNTIANLKGELKAITTRSVIVLDGPSIPMPPPFINPEVDERLEETLTDLELGEFTIKVPPHLVQKSKPPSQRNFMVYQRDPIHPNIPYPLRMHKQKQQEKDEVQIHKFWQMFEQLHININLADALILIPQYQKMLKALLSSKQKLLELANTPINENCSAVIRKKLPEKLRVLGNFSFCVVLISLPPHNINPLSGSTTSSSNHLLEEFADELALITFRPRNDDLPFDIESDLKEIEYLLNHNPIKEMDSTLEDSIDESNLTNPNVNLFDTIPEMFTDEHARDYLSPPLYDEYDDDLDEIEFQTDDAYTDPFDSNEEKIKESKLLIDELDLPRSSDFLPSPEYDSFLFEDFSEVDVLPSTNNEDKVFNLSILIQENLSEVTVQAELDKNVKKIAISYASLILEDFNPPLSNHELPFHQEVPESETLLLFSSENEEKVFKPRILPSKGVHSSLFLELSHRGPKAFKVIKIFESPMEIFPCSYREDIRILDVPCLHF